MQSNAGWLIRRNLRTLAIQCAYESRCITPLHIDKTSILHPPFRAVPPHDVVVASYVLREVERSQSRDSIIRSLWAHTAGVLVIVEPGTCTLPPLSFVTKCFPQWIFVTVAQAHR